MPDNVIALDYETFYHKTEYSIRGMGNWRYCHDDRFDPYLLSAYDGSNSWVGHPNDFNWDCLHAYDTVLAHNAGFERAVTDALIEQGRVPEFVRGLGWQCTANLTSFLVNERALKNAVQLLEHRSISKGIRDDMSGKTWRDAEQAGIAKALAEYALGDVRECYNIWTKYNHLWNRFERGLSELTMRQCSRGVNVNVDLLREYTAVLKEVLFNLERALPWTERGKKPTSPIAVAEECRKVGIPAPPVKDEDEEGFIQWEKVYGPKYEWVCAVGQWRQINKMLTMLETIDDRLRPDNTIDFSLLYFGAHTGRWSGGGSGLNMQNMRKVPIFLKKMRLVIPPDNLNKDRFKAWAEANTDYALDVRMLFIPRPGKKFILADLSQIEPRVLAWLTGNWKFLDLLRGGMSIYEAFARSNMGWKGGRLKDENMDLYNMSKIQVLGLGYGCGWEKFIAIAAGYGVVLDEMQSRSIVSTFRESNPKITRLWGQLDSAFQRSYKKNFDLELPSGRVITYHDVDRVSKMKRNRETGKYENKLVFTARIGRQHKELYGGLLTENLVQATAREIFGQNMLEIENDVGEVIFHVHDEAITEVDQDVQPKDIEHIMSQTPEWMPGLPCGAEALETDHYLKA